MALKQFLQNLFERVGLAEAPMPPPHAAHVTLAAPQLLRPIFARLAVWGIKQVQLVVSGSPDANELAQAINHAVELSMAAGIRGRASDLAGGKLLAGTALAGASEVEIPLLSAVAEVHDALAGMGDHRCALKLLDELPGIKLSSAVQVVLAPSTWKTIQRTMELLDDRGVRVVRVWAIACRDDEPASWAFSASELVTAAEWIESHVPKGMQFNWHPPLRFDPARTLAEQVRRGPRAARDAVRIEADGSIISPIGTATAGGNVSQNDWKPIARSEVFRAWNRRRDAAARCEQCPGLMACAGGCLRDDSNWMTE